ncbi:MAG: glycine cleavage system protein H [Acidobacteria bacterium]|nr:glycine cleavage system protein H [Acidobacteriota bacterium]
MTVLFVLAMFLVFALIDWVLSRGKVEVAEEAPGLAPALGEDYVYGFHVPQNRRYHPGHGWAMRERKNVVRVGIDDFAARLAGKIEGLELPKPGQWLRQGQRSWKLFRNGKTAEMASPIEGEVLEVNPEVLKDPSLLRRDPYGEGWLMTLHVPDEEGTSRNFIPRDLIRGWMESVAEKLYVRQPELAGVVAADAGQPVEDIAEALGESNWQELTNEFFL